MARHRGSAHAFQQALDFVVVAELELRIGREDEWSDPVLDAIAGRGIHRDPADAGRILEPAREPQGHGLVDRDPERPDPVVEGHRDASGLVHQACRPPGPPRLASEWASGLAATTHARSSPISRAIAIDAS